jgi:hypothetical protein
MTRIARRGVLVLTASLGFLAASTVTASAGAPPADQGSYTVKQAVCNVSADPSETNPLEIGGQVRMEEFGNHRVVSFKVKYLLYAGKPSTLNPSQVRQTYETEPFGSNSQNTHWLAPYQSWHVVQGDKPWYLIAKMTWDRTGRRDWNEKVTLAICS